MRERSQGSLARRAGCLVAVLFVFGIVLCTMVMLSPRVDKYRFLDGRKPLFGGVMPAMSHGPNFGYDYSAYCWEESYESVFDKADKELASLGFRVMQRDRDSATWQKNHDLFIGMMRGRSYSKVDYFQPRNRSDKWVTIKILLPADGSLANQLRSALEPDIED